jgi:murein DD-endopeptidase MepM/ murein hydrolase activator NlpD
MTDRAAIADRVGAAGAAAAAIVALTAALFPGTAVAAGTPCVAAGMLAVVAPDTVAPQPVGPALSAADRQSATTDTYADTTGGTGLTVAHVVIGAAGCVNPAGTPGGTSTRATRWSALAGAVGGSSLQVDLVPVAAPGADWHLRPNLDGLLIAGKPAVLPEGGTIALGAWGVLDRPETIDAGAAAPLRWWKAAFEVRITRAHAGLAAGTRLLFGWVSADRAPAAPPPVAPPPTTTTTATAPKATVPTATAPTITAPAKPKSPTSTKKAHATRVVRKPAAKKLRARHKKARHRQARIGLPLRVTPTLGGATYDFPVLGTASWGDTYGANRSDVPGGWHHGDDLFVALGTPVVAVATGTVFAVGWNRVGGWRLWLEDAQGNDFYYAHLSGYTKLARQDNHVRRGQVLGFVGNTGDAFTTIPHLHFEVHPFGLLPLGYDGAVDPTRYLASWQQPGGVDVLPPVPLPLPNFRGSGSLTDYRRLLALRPLAKSVAAPPKSGEQAPEDPKPQRLASTAIVSKASDGWTPMAAGALLLALAAIAVGLTAREGRARSGT